MATFALIHGAGDVGWYWHLVQEELERRGHAVVAPDLPCEDDSAGLSEYTDTVVAAIGGRRDLVVVGQSFGGFTAPLVAARLPVTALVLVAGMIPAPGESPEEWLVSTGFRYEESDDPFYHDVPPHLAAAARSRSRSQSGTPGREPWPLDAWPPVPARFVLCTEDRFFRPDFMRRVVAARLPFLTPDEITAGHCAALSHPKELARLLESQVRD
jgi:pimeloyl-ACP methyl ester carboxylesterase